MFDSILKVKKIRAENEEKRSRLREKENTGNCPFENIGFYLVIENKIKRLGIFQAVFC